MAQLERKATEKDRDRQKQRAFEEEEALEAQKNAQASQENTKSLLDNITAFQIE